jgi:hypothetical protein
MYKPVVLVVVLELEGKIQLKQMGPMIELMLQLYHVQTLLLEQ